jgi:ketosteroid isomerase-like protein
MKNTSANLLERSLLELWNERDSVRRLELMQELYAPDIVFFESDTTEIKGHEAINNTIAGLQANWAPDFAFRLVSPAANNHNFIHAAWTLGSVDAAPVASGRDIAVVENGMIQSLHLFLEKTA